MKEPQKEHFDIWQSIPDWARAIMRFLGREAIDGVVPKSVAIPSTDAAHLREKRFSETSGWPSEKSKDFLAVKWNQHHAGRTARPEETAGQFPALLIRLQDRMHSLEVRSAKDLDPRMVAPVTRELSAEDMAKLSEILGGPDHVSICEESEFCAQSFCPPSQMEDWLQDFWIEYDISAVLAGSQIVAPDPIVLVNQYHEFFTVRLFSPSDALDQESVEGDREDAEISELNHIYFLSDASDDQLP